MLAAAETGQPVDLGELEELMDAREACRRQIGLPPVDQLAERALDTPLPLEQPPPEEFPPDPSTLQPCEHCGFDPDHDDVVIPGHRLAVAWDPDGDSAAAVDLSLRGLRTVHRQTPVLVRAPAAAVAAWASPYGYDPASPEAADLYAAVAPEVATIPWPPARNEPCWCGSGQKYKRCCGR